MEVPLMAFGIDDAIAAGLKVLDKFVPDPQEKAKAESELRNALQSWDKQQTDVNAIEAANSSLFVSGWRPAIGWIGASGLAYAYILRPFLVGAGWTSLPQLDNNLYELVIAMLGLAGMRSWEKYKGLAR
jgi:hypothetical protein